MSVDATYTDPTGGLISPAAELLLHFPVIDKVEPKMLQGKVAKLQGLFECMAGSFRNKLCFMTV